MNHDFVLDNNNDIDKYLVRDEENYSHDMYIEDDNDSLSYEPHPTKKCHFIQSSPGPLRVSNYTDKNFTELQREQLYIYPEPSNSTLEGTPSKDNEILANEYELTNEVQLKMHLQSLKKNASPLYSNQYNDYRNNYPAHNFDNILTDNLHIDQHPFRQERPNKRRIQVFHRSRKSRKPRHSNTSDRSGGKTRQNKLKNFQGLIFQNVKTKITQENGDY